MIFKNMLHGFRLGTLAAVCAASIGSQAADRPAAFAVAAAQITALGIQTTPVANMAESVKASYPAQVVIPLNAQQVISAPLAGLVLQILVQQNQRVAAGVPLIRIASPELGQLQLQLIQASTKATLTRQASQREKELFAEGLIAQRRVQEAQSAQQDADAGLNQAKAALRLGGMSAAAISRVSATGTVQDSVVITAPKASVVTDIQIKPGQRVDATTALMSLAQTDTLWLEIQVPATETIRWAAGTELKVQGRDVSAQVMTSAAVVDASSQMVMVRALIRGAEGKVRPGELVTVELPTAPTAGGWDLPQSAVAYDGNQAHVFVRTPEGFEARAVKVAASAGQKVRVVGPIKVGEQVAIHGVVALKGAWLTAKEVK